MKSCNSMLMGPTMTHEQPAAPTLDCSHSFYSNAASAPLPLIPRRSPSVSRSQSYPPTHFSSKTNVNVRSPTSSEIAIQTPEKVATGPFDYPHTSSSHVPDNLRSALAPRSKKLRSQRFPIPCPSDSSIRMPPMSTPLKPPPKSCHSQCEEKNSDDSSSRPPDCQLDSDLQRRPVKRASDALRLDLSAFHTVHMSDSSDTPSIEVTATTQSPIKVPPDVETKLVRKKSGQLVKSSLKSTKSQDRGSLSVVTCGILSKSEPTTPTHTKAVHFDSRLEHIKLFLAEQKPLAVSRDSSPTTDTSGTDTDFPYFIYGDSAKGNSRDQLVMDVLNMPAKPNASADIALEELKLSQDTMNILGNVRVRNIAYQKWIAVRFTFDFWQTTSEVTAKYTQTLRGRGFDIFSFTIKLNDLFAHIEEKTLIMALRYTVQGMEIWDNNGGQNYLARFKKSKMNQGNTNSDDISSSGDVADLKNKLDFANRKEGLHFVQMTRRSSDAFHKPPAIKEVPSLATRYDLSASFKNVWKPPCTTVADTSVSAARNSIPWPPKGDSGGDRKPLSPSLRRKNKPLGSPRDIDDDDLRQVGPDVEDFPFHRNRAGRNHQRSYFNIAPCDGGNLRRTPPGTPLVNSVNDETLRSPAFTAKDGDQRSMERTDSGGSEESSLSIVSPSSSSRSVSPSPTEMFMMSHLTGPYPGKPCPAESSTDYSQFLNKFCFYTGTDNLSDADLTPPEMPARSLSASSIDTLPTTPTRAHYTDHLSPFSTPTRTQSFDETLYRSGSSARTARTISEHTPYRFNIAT